MSKVVKILANFQPELFISKSSHQIYNNDMILFSTKQVSEGKKIFY